MGQKRLAKRKKKLSPISYSAISGGIHERGFKKRDPRHISLQNACLKKDYAGIVCRENSA